MSMLNKVNFIYGAIAAFFAAAFGKYWFLFAGFIIFNVVDWLTGWYASYLNHEESSRTGLKGILNISNNDLNILEMLSNNSKFLVGVIEKSFKST